MKKTKHFVSTQVDSTRLPFVVNEVEELKNVFIEDSFEKVGEVESEQIQVVVMPNSSYIQIILSLTYYTKP